MQPEPHSMEDEKKQSEPPLAQAAPPEETPSTLQTETISAPKPVESAPAAHVEVQTPTIPEKKPAKKWNFLYVAIGGLALLAFVVVAWIGYWAYVLNTDLTSTQQQLSALQADHEKLQADFDALKSTNDQLTADLAQTKTDLEKANKDLETTQADLSKAQKKNNDLKAKTDKAVELADILYAWNTAQEKADLLEINSMIDTSSDEQLRKSWKDLANSTDTNWEENLNTFLNYLIAGIRLSLK
ncbi:MAG: hypothetical protein QM730_09615 [Anaerolineales bacterium]